MRDTSGWAFEKPFIWLPKFILVVVSPAMCWGSGTVLGLGNHPVGRMEFQLSSVQNPVSRTGFPFNYANPQSVKSSFSPPNKKINTARHSHSSEKEKKTLLPRKSHDTPRPNTMTTSSPLAPWPAVQSSSVDKPVRKLQQAKGSRVKRSPLQSQLYI